MTSKRKSGPRPATTWSAIAERGDIRLHSGLLTIVHNTIAPMDATVSDLVFIGDALQAAGITPLLVRTAGRRPVLALDIRDREAAAAALREASVGEPFYAEAGNGEPLLVAEIGRRLPESGRVVTVFRPRITEGGTLHYGVREGVRLEFWKWGEDAVRAPAKNALTRRDIPNDEISLVTIHRFGRDWRTLEHMFDPHPNDFPGEIDLVFSWVDGSSSEFQRLRAQRMNGYVVGDGDDSSARFRHVDELRYALRSVHMFAPWIRRIFVATDSDKPAWLADDPRVTFVRSEEFFADTSVLPTHNSHAVEAQLHHIDGLSEYFLYSNDDMFFGRAVTPELFFTPGGVSQFVESSVRIGVGAAEVRRSGHDNAARVNRDLLRDAFGVVITRDLEHCAAPMRRSVMGELNARFPEEFARTAAARFRSATDVSVTNSLYHYFALATGRAVVTKRPRTRYVQTTMYEAIPRMRRLLANRNADMFCLNDGGNAQIPEHVRVDLMRDYLESYFPVRAPWEVADAAELGSEEGRAEASATPADFSLGEPSAAVSAARESDLSAEIA